MSALHEDIDGWYEFLFFASEECQAWHRDAMDWMTGRSSEEP
jgi:hypothetical protein